MPFKKESVGLVECDSKAEGCFASVACDRDRLNIVGTAKETISGLHARTVETTNKQNKPLQIGGFMPIFQ